MVQIPKKCRAAVVLGGQIQLGEIDVPQPSGHQLLVRVRAAGVNHADVYQRQGKYSAPEGASSVLGLELSGDVIEIGSAVSRFKVGDRVMALVSGGAYAEYCLVDEETTLPIPRSLSFEIAAAVPESYFTIWSNVFDSRMAGLQSGETLLVHGGASGVGSSTIQLAKWAGATVIATAGSKEKCTACRELGADFVIPYKDKDFGKEIPTLLGGKGVDVIFDWVGSSYFPKHIAILNRFGRLVLIDSHTGNDASLDLRKLFQKNLKVMGSVLRRRPMGEKERICQEVEKLWLTPLADGKLRPRVHGSFALADAQKAHDLMEQSGHTGKILIVP